MIKFFSRWTKPNNDLTFKLSNKKNRWQLLGGGISALVILAAVFISGLYIGGGRITVLNNHRLAYFQTTTNDLTSKTDGAFNPDLYWTVWQTLKNNYV